MGGERGGDDGVRRSVDGELTDGEAADAPSKSTD